MTEPVQTLTQQLLHRTTDPSTLALLTGAASSSFWFFGALGVSAFGILPATLSESERAKKGVSDASALKLWKWMFDRAVKPFSAAAILSSTSYLVASAFRPDLRPLLYGSSIVSLSALPYTLVVLMPINKDILKVAKEVSESDAKGPEPGLADKLFSEWRKYNFIRLSIAGAAWSLGVTALLLA